MTAAPNIGHDGQARLFAPSELRTPRRPPAEAPPPRSAYRPGRETFILRVKDGDPEQSAGTHTLFGTPPAAAVRAIVEHAPGPPHAVKVEDGAKLAHTAGVLAFYVPDERRRLVLFALVDGLTLAEAREHLRRAA